jgi:hypothetical protein
MAQKQMGEQSSRMEALRNVVQQQADKGVALEKVSRSQATELRNLKGELDRLQILLRTREQEALIENKAKNDQLIEKTNQLGNELLKAGKIRENTAELRGEIEKLKIMLASAERVNAILMAKETDEKLREMVEIENTRAKEMGSMKEEVVRLGAKVDEGKYGEAMEDLGRQLGRLYGKSVVGGVAVKEEKLVKVEAKGDGKVYPEGKVAGKEKKGCNIL